MILIDKYMYSTETRNYKLNIFVISVRLTKRRKFGQVETDVNCWIKLLLLLSDYLKLNLVLKGTSE